jgi:hypothetical protein
MRDDFSLAIKNSLAGRVCLRCSICGKLTSGPKIDPAGVINVGVAAHITAASSGGPRYDPALTPGERSGIENGIWLCQMCAKLVDSDPIQYPAQRLREWKRLAEEATLAELEGRGSPREMGRWVHDPEVADRLRSAILDAAEALIIQGLTTISSPDAPEDKTIVKVRSKRNIYIQFAAEGKDGSVYGESVCNAYLDGDEVLADEQIGRLLSYGWNPPEKGYFNFHREWKITNHADLRVIALEAIRAFSEVYRIERLDEVDLRTFR